MNPNRENVVASSIRELQATWKRIEERAARTPVSVDAISSPAKCPICGDLGWVVFDVPPDHAKFGKAHPCNCSAAQIADRRVDHFIKNAHVLDEHRGRTFDSFMAACNNNLVGKQAAFDAAWYFSQGVDPQEESDRRGLFFWGQYGTGKSGLAALAMFGRAALGQPVACIDWRDFVAQVQDTYSEKKGPSRRALTHGAGDVHNLLIDELGKLDRFGQPVPIANDKIEITEELIRWRHARRLPTIITSNLSFKQVEDVFGRYLIERIGQLCIVLEVGGVNLRNQS